MYSEILKSLENKYGKLPTSTKKQVVQKLLSVNFDKYKNYSPSSIIESMTNALAKNLSIKKTPAIVNTLDPPDMNNYMQQEIKEEYVNEAPAIELDITKIFGVTNINDLKMLIEPSLLHKKAYICLDSFNKNPNNSTTSKFSWDYSITRNDNIGVVYTTKPIKNIVSIQLYQPLFPTPSSSFQVVNTQRVSILIEEFSNRAHLASGGGRYHWLTKVNGALQIWSPARHSILQIEEFNDGVVKFNPPISIYSTITLSFGDPNTKLEFYPDVMNATVTAYGATTTITTASAHNISSTDLIYVEGFASTSGFNDSTINTDFGHTATVTSSTAFTIPVDTSSGTFISNAPITVKFFRYRLILPMEITYLDHDVNLHDT
jgi:hypothetical protein